MGFKNVTFIKTKKVIAHNCKKYNMLTVYSICIYIYGKLKFNVLKKKKNR